MDTKIVSKIRASNKYISAILLAAIMLITIAQILMRSIFDIPLVGIEELSRFLFISFIFLGLSYYNRIDGHIKLEGLQKNFPLKIKRIIGIIIHVSSAVVFGIITFSAVYTSLTNYNSSTQTLAIPFWLFFLPTIVGFALLTVEEIIILIDKCKKKITAWE
jgi:TRAP-type C4-dicarboxylate transport system permease small subunit